MWKTKIFRHTNLWQYILLLCTIFIKGLHSSPFRYPKTRLPALMRTHTVMSARTKIQFRKIFYICPKTYIIHTQIHTHTYIAKKMQIFQQSRTDMSSEYVGMNFGNPWQKVGKRNKKRKKKTKREWNVKQITEKRWETKKLKFFMSQHNGCRWYVNVRTVV